MGTIMLFGALPTSEFVACFKILLWILAAVTSEAAAYSMNVIAHPHDVDAVEGSRVTLTCKFDAPVPLCSWVKDGVIYAAGGRYSFANPASGDCSLSITAVSLLKDDGKWQCQNPATSEMPATTSIVVKLSVLVVPGNPVIFYHDQEIPQGTELALGSSFTAKCSSKSGNPAAQLRWVLDGQRIEGGYSFSNYTGELAHLQRLQNSQNILILNDTEHLGDKILMCVAEHPAFNESQRETWIQLKSPTPTTISEARINGSFSEEVDVDMDSELVLVCWGDGFPSPRYRWEKRNIDDAGNVYWEFVGLGEVLRVRVTDDALYSCTAENGVSSERIRSNYITLTVLHKPTLPATAEIGLPDVRMSSTADVGLIGGISAACTLLIVLCAALFAHAYRKKAYIMSPTPKSTHSDEENGVSKSAPHAENHSLLQDQHNPKNVSNGSGGKVAPHPNGSAT